MRIQSLPHDHAHPAADVARLADRVGAMASFLCALHCAALPFVLTLLPVLGLDFLASHRFEHWFIAFATVLASTMLIRGYRGHRQPHALALLLPGLLLLWSGGYLVEPEVAPFWHATLVALGGSTVAAAHLVNLRLAHTRRDCCTPGGTAIV